MDLYVETEKVKTHQSAGKGGGRGGRAGQTDRQVVLAPQQTDSGKMEVGIIKDPATPVPALW